MYDIIILQNHMTTISVPLTAELMKLLEKLLEEGAGATKADIMRKALKKLAEDQAVQDVLDALKEPTLHGDLRELAKKIV